jgi:hypothetical protein
VSQSMKGEDHLPNYKVKKVHRRRRRKRKLRYLRRRLAETTDSAQRQRLITKIRRISPHGLVPES